MNTRPATLQAVEAAVWQGLADAAGRKTDNTSHGWRTLVLATVDQPAGGEALPDARTVVLREVDVAQRRLLVYTDSRAAKVAQLQASPLGMLVAWAPALGWQLRCRVQLSAEDSGLSVSSRWARIRLSPAAQDYLSPLPPGSPLGGQAPALAQREHFAVISAQVLSIDWLELHPDGHRRARFDADGSRWTQP